MSTAEFPASLMTPGQIESRLAYSTLHRPGPKPPWWQDYLAIQAEFPHFKNWRIWVYIAWISQPPGARQPATIEELAPQVLGCTSRAVRNWYRLDFGEMPTIAEAIAWAQAAPLLRSRREIFDALVSVAVMPDPKAHNDRKMALEMLGDYRPRGVNDADRSERDRLEGYLNALKEAA